jgi:hypothetical protein
MAKLSTEEFRELVETEVLTVPEAADYLGMTRQGVWFQIKAGRITAIRKKLILRADLDDYDAKAHKGPPRTGRRKT